MKRVAYLNCEVRGRDLESRLLIASQLVQLGIPVVLGQMWALLKNAAGRKCPPGVFLFTTANRIQAVAMSWMKKAGSLVIASDEESLCLSDPTTTISAEAIEVCDRFLVNSHPHRQILVQRHANAEEKFITTGSARIQVIREIEISPAIEPPFLLFNTGFPLVNSVWADDTAVETATEVLGVSAVRTRIVGQHIGMDFMLSLIRHFRGHRIVIRPHPAERAKTWREAFPDIEVVERSDPLPWIRGARVLIHANSTTGLEAALLGTPTLNLDPISAYGDFLIVKKFNHTVNTKQQALDVLETFLEYGSGLDTYQPGDADYPPQGAVNIAHEIAILMNDAPSLEGEFKWVKMPRSLEQQAKFTVSRKEVDDHPAIRSIPDLRVKELDDSVFFLERG